MNLQLKGKVALVLASGSGIGAGVAKELASEGAKVMMMGHTKKKLSQKTAQIIKETGNKNVINFAGDLTDINSIKELIKKTQEKLGPVYALFNNAGGPPAGKILSFSDKDWYYAFDLTLLSYVRVMKLVIPQMKKGGEGRIVNSTSSSIKSVLPNLGLSNTMRAGIVGLSKTISQEEGKNKILCNVTAPGTILTDRVKSLNKIRAQKQNKTALQVEKESIQEIPLGRYGKPSEYSKLVAFLLSPLNTYITGQSILIDGGMVKAL